MRRVLILLSLALLLPALADAQAYIRYYPPKGVVGMTSGGTSISFTVPLLAPAADNCAAVPYSFTGDTNTGVCSSAADTVGLIAGGTTQLSATTTAVTSTVPILLPAGTAATKPLAFASSAGTGLYLPDQTNFLGTLYLGTGGGALSHTSGTTGQTNMYVGINAGDANTTAQGNTGVGYAALASATSGLFNTAVGRQALFTATTATQNTAIGVQALYNTTLTAGADNVAVGHQAMFNNTTGKNNMAIGSGALYTSVTGIDNAAIGFNSLFLATGHYNTAIGKGALQGVTTGESNVGIGVNAGYSPGGVTANATTTGGTNTFIGRNTGYSSTTQYDNSTAIGYGALTSASDQVVLGNASVTEVQAGIGGVAKLYAKSVAFPLVADAVVQYGQVVMPDASADGRFDVNATNSTLGIGVLGGVGASAQGTAYPVINSGQAYVAVQEDAAVTRGHYLIVSATAGYTNDSATVTTDGLNIALSLYSEAVTAVIVHNGCTGGAGCVNTALNTPNTGPAGQITLGVDVAALGWAVGQPVTYWNSGGTSIAGLTDGATYFLASVATTNVTLAATYGGAVIVPTGQGTDATQYLIRLPLAVIAIH